MSGAAALPDKSNMAPASRNATKTGSSHHFLVWQTNSHSSRTKLVSDTAASSNALLSPSLIRVTSSKLAEITQRVGHFATRLPVARFLAPATAPQRVPARNAKQQADRRHQTVEQQRQQ